MSSIVEALLSATPSTLADAGGEDIIWDAIDELADSPALPLAVELVAASWPVANPEEALRLVGAGLARSTSPLAFADTLDATLDVNADLATRAAGVVRHACQSRVDNRSSPKDGYMAGVALEALLRLGLAGDVASRFATLAALATVADGDDVAFREVAARCCGVAYDHWREPTARSVLDVLAGDDVTGGEAAQQRGLAEIVDAVTGPTAEATAHFTSAVTLFERAAADDFRPDAQVYLAVSQAMVAFLARDAALLASSVSRLREALLVRLMWAPAEDRYRWLAPRRTAEIEWATLIEVLDVAVTEAASEAWLLRASSVLGAAANAYATARAVRLTATSDGLAELVEPEIAALLAQHEALVELVAQALSDPSVLGVPIEELERIRDRISVRESEPPGKGDGGDRWPTLGAVADVAVAGTASTSMLGTLDRLEARLHDFVAADGPLHDPIIDSVLDDLHASMDSGATFPDAARHAFFLVLGLTLRFVKDRMDVSRHTAGDRVAYLRPTPSEGDYPVEADMMSDYREFFVGSPVGSRVTVEQWDVAAGRIDLMVTVGPWKVVVEGKRCFEPATQNVVRALAIGQAAAYQQTNMTASIALVLDLSNKSGVVPRHLVDAVWLDTVQSAGVDRHVVVVVLPGGILTPSAVRLPKPHS